MARLGLGRHWQCTFANEWCEKKAAAYRAYFGGSDLRVCDVAALTPDDLPAGAALVWASFPCQDLSLAGAGAGLDGKRSGTFRPFWNLIRAGPTPKIVVLENVVGALSSHCGADFNFILNALGEAGYRAGALVIDAVRFLPQSRPRLFVVACHKSLTVPERLMLDAPGAWHPRQLCTAYDRLTDPLRRDWIWWRLPEPDAPVAGLDTVIENEPTGVSWHSREQTAHLIGLMSDLHLEKLAHAKTLGKRVIGTVYRRTRPDSSGGRRQRAEIRFDQIAGCLRTPAGGSSRQTVVIVEGCSVRSRLLSAREAARLMGIPEEYPVPLQYNEAYHLFGDGVAVPVVAWLEKHLLRPLAVGQAVLLASRLSGRLSSTPTGTRRKAD